MKTSLHVDASRSPNMQYILTTGSQEWTSGDGDGDGEYQLSGGPEVGDREQQAQAADEPSPPARGRSRGRPPRTQPIEVVQDGQTVLLNPREYRRHRRCVCLKVHAQICMIRSCRSHGQCSCHALL